VYDECRTVSPRPCLFTANPVVNMIIILCVMLLPLAVNIVESVIPRRQSGDTINNLTTTITTVTIRTRSALVTLCLTSSRSSNSWIIVVILEVTHYFYLNYHNIKIIYNYAIIHCSSYTLSHTHSHTHSKIQIYH